MRSTKSAKPEIGGVTPSITPRTGKIILAVKPRGSEFFGGVDQQLTLYAYRAPGLCDRESRQSAASFGGVGARSKGDPKGWDPLSDQEPKQDV